jgi:trigger factor
MALIERHDVDALNVSLSITLPKEEINEKLKKELNRFAQKVTIRGFRKGKTPVSYIKKIYGGDILNDIVNKELSENIDQFIKSNDLDILGYPIPSEEKIENNFTIDRIEDIRFKFDLGLAPKFEIKGLSKDFKFSKYVPEIPEKWIDEALEGDRKRKGGRQTVEGGDLQENDIIKINAKEVGGELEKSFSVLFQDLSDDMKALIGNKKTGDSFEFDILTMEQNADAERVRKYILGVDENVTFDNIFNGTIEEVTRITPAEVNEAYYKETYGEDVTNEAEARILLNDEFVKHLEPESMGLLMRDLQDHIIAQNQFDLPDIFLKRWLQASNSKNTAEIVERDYANYARSIHWTLLKDQLIEELNVHIHESDVYAEYLDKVRSMGYGSQLGEDFVRYMADHLMKEGEKTKSKAHQEAIDSAMIKQLFKVIANQVDVTDYKISWDDYNAKREAAIKANEAERRIEISDEVEEMVEQ